MGWVPIGLAPVQMTANFPDGDWEAGMRVLAPRAVFVSCEGV